MSQVSQARSVTPASELDQLVLPIAVQEKAGRHRDKLESSKHVQGRKSYRARMPDKEQIEAKRASNRRSAHASRRRRQMLIKRLEARVASLKEENGDLRNDNRKLLLQLESVLKQNYVLQAELQRSSAKSLSNTYFIRGLPTLMGSANGAFNFSPLALQRTSTSIACKHNCGTTDTTAPDATRASIATTLLNLKQL